MTVITTFEGLIFIATAITIAALSYMFGRCDGRRQ